MNDLESQRAATQELFFFAQQHGIDLSSMGFGWAFLKEGRFISLWRKEDRIHYSLQEPIDVLPEKMKASAALFRGMWVEGGSFENLHEALELLKAWLIDRKEIDDLPTRSVRSYGI